jgi:hypothetical protein
MEDIVVDFVSEMPVPVWFVHLPGGQEWFRPPFDWDDLLPKLDEELLLCEFRGVSIERYEFILKHGIDVEPTNSVIFADGFDKAWEYGNWPKLILALDSAHLQRTFIKVAANISHEELQKLRQRFPTVVESVDKTTLWLSRLPEGSRLMATPYEFGYAWWIEGNPFDALRALIIFARPEDGLKLPSFST